MTEVALLTADVALAFDVSNYALAELLGANPQRSNVDVHIDYHPDGSRTVNLISRRVHVAGTRHLYKCMVSVTLNKFDYHYLANRVCVHLSHPRTGEWDEDNGCTFVGDLEPGLDNVTMFSTSQDDVDNVHHSARHLLPRFGSHFTVAS